MGVKSFFRLCLRAGILAVLLQVPLLSEHMRSDGFSPKLFTDWDEPFYFTIAYRMGELPWSEIADRMPWISAHESERLRMELPSSMTDVLLGKFGLALGLWPVTLGWLLDVLCFFFSYVGFTFFFRALSGSRWGGEIAACTMLLLPWLLFPERACDVPLNFQVSGIYVTSRACNVWPSLPVWRGFYTQLSYPVLAAGLFVLVSGRFGRKLAGALLGSLIYFYVFAWVAAICVSAIYLVLQSSKDRWKHLIQFALTAGVVSAPGLLWFLCGYSPIRESLVLPEGFPKFFHLSPMVLLMIGFFAFARSRVEDPDKNRVIDFILSVLAAEVMLPNYELISRQLWLEDHFRIFYLEPLLSGAVSALIFGYLAMKSTQIAFVLVLLLLSAREQQNISNFRERYHHRMWDLEFLSKAIVSKTAPKERLFYLSPNAANYELPPEVEALTRRKVDAPSFLTTLFEHREEGLRKELFVSWFLRDKFELFNECPVPYDTSGRRWSVHNWISYRRSDACLRAAEIAKDFSPCEILRSLQGRYIIWENPDLESIAPEKRTILRREFMTNGNLFGLYKINELPVECTEPR